jgi:antitoxin PrlF
VYRSTRHRRYLEVIQVDGCSLAGFNEGHPAHDFLALRPPHSGTTQRWTAWRRRAGGAAKSLVPPASLSATSSSGIEDAGTLGILVPAGAQIDKVRKFPYDITLTIGRTTMPAIHEVATLTSKGQITLPKSIRQALGVDTGGKVAFDLRGGEVVVTRADAEHEDPAIGAFLSLLEADIRAGRHVRSLPDDLAQAMLATAGHAVDLDEDIDGEVAI